MDDEAERSFPSFEASSLSPLVEFYHFSSPIRSGISSPPDWLLLGRQNKLWCQLGIRGGWYSDSNGNQGIASISHIQSCPNRLIDFEMRAKRAAKSAGFSDDVAGKLIAAISELLSNVLEHCGNPESGYLVFDAVPEKFNFVVADHGIGALASLRQNPEYSTLEDSGTALELALREGVSRHQEKGRGLGFRPLLVGLANMCDFIRFRSQNYSREYTRLLNGEVEAQTHEKAPLKGFFCACSIENRNPR